MLTADLIDDPAGLEPWSEAWDRLAVELSQPCSSPKWMSPLVAACSDRPCGAAHRGGARR